MFKKYSADESDENNEDWRYPTNTYISRRNGALIEFFGNGVDCVYDVTGLLLIIRDLSRKSSNCGVDDDEIKEILEAIITVSNLIRDDLEFDQDYIISYN